MVKGEQEEGGENILAEEGRGGKRRKLGEKKSKRVGIYVRDALGGGRGTKRALFYGGGGACERREVVA